MSASPTGTYAGRAEIMRLRVICATCALLICSGQTLVGQTVDAVSDTPLAEAQPTDGAGNNVNEDVASLDTPDDFEDIELLELDVPVVVTAARREEKITQVPYAVYIVTREDIRRAGALTIPDALRLVPGVDVAALSSNNSAVSPRGLHSFLSRMTLVLIDGRQAFDSFFGGEVWGAWPVQVEDIERIEVIRGPGGVTWGANAVNGVINIITRVPRDQQRFSSITTGGSRGLVQQYFRYGSTENGLRFRVSGEFGASDGFDVGGSLLRDLDDKYRKGSLALHAVIDATDRDSLTFSTGSSLVENGFPPTPMALWHERQAGAQTNYALGRWQHQVAPGNSFEITGYVNNFWGSPGIRSANYRYQQYALQYAHTLRAGPRHTFSWGIDTRFDYVDASNADPHMLRQSRVRSGIVGLYLQDEWQFHERWRLNLGARIDYESYGGFQPSARTALSYQINERESAYAAISRAFQMPPAAFRFMATPFAAGLVQTTSVQDLDATPLLAYELGYRGRHFGRLDVGVALFWHEYGDITLFEPRLGPPALLNLQNRNLADASLYGIELDARFQATDDLTLLGNYTYQFLNWRSDLPYVYKDSIYPPDHKFMVGAHYDVLEDLHLAGHLYFVDGTKAPNPAFALVSRSIDSYFRLDLRAEYEFWDDRAAFAVGVQNLLDHHHPESSTLFLNDAEVPRTFFAQLRINFD